MAAGSPDTLQRATLLWQELLAHYEAPPLDPAINEALQEYVARRELELGSKNLYD